MANKDYVILDCDIGTDDAWALLSLIKSELENPGKVKLLGITCVEGNTSVDNVAVNTLRILEYVDRLDVPVFKGCHEPILPRRIHQDEKPDNKYFHGKDGLGDLEYSTNVDESFIQKKHAVNAMYDFVCQYPNQVTFICVGPLTNFATCINMFHDFRDKVKNVFIMGGNIMAVGNATPSAEFNFFMDPEAAHIVLGKSKCPITILPWESCRKDKFDLSLEWRLTTFENSKNEAIKLLNKAEEKLYGAKGFKEWVPCDAMLTACFLIPEILIKKESTWHATVELNGYYTRGQMILDHLMLGNKIENVRIIEEIDVEKYKKFAMWTGDF